MMDKSKNSSKGGNLEVHFKYSQMYIPTGSQVLALDGTCVVTGYSRHRLNWQAVINGQTVTGSLDNVCNTTSKTFSMSINLAPYSLPENTKFNIFGAMVGIDSRGKMIYGKTNSLSIAMVNGSGTGTITSGGTTGGVAGLDGESTGTNTDGTDPWIPPDVCTPGPSEAGRIGELEQANWIEPNAHIAEWPITSEITNVTFNGAGEICIEHTMLGRWPAVDTFGVGENTTEGNYWFVSGFGDSYFIVWPFHWYRPGQSCKSVSFTNTGRYSGVGGAITPVTYWTPCSGSIVGIVASTPGRTGTQGPVQERSDIYWFRWP